MTFDPLVQTGWLADHLDNPDIRIVDIRGYVKKRDLGGGRQEAEYLAARDEYDEAHIPRAVYVDWTSDITDPGDPVPAQVAPPERFADLMGSLGVDYDTHVIVYDHAGSQFATRLWWALVYYGHERVSVLDGGWKKWIAEDRPVSARIPTPEPAIFIPRPQAAWRADAGTVLVASQTPGDALILDARDQGQYTGAVTRGEGRPGHVPGAAHLHADSLLREGGTFLEREEIEGSLRDAGASEDRNTPIVAYCNGGVAATLLLFNLYRLGYANLSNYDGSWNEWGVREDLPVER